MSTADPEGGLGGASGRTTRDTRLVERALREGWPIPRAPRGPLVDRLAGIVTDPETSPREAVSAARALLSASKINLEVVGAVFKARKFDEMEERLAVVERLLV